VASIDAVEGSLLLLRGDRLLVRYTVDDDGTSTVRLVLDTDGIAATTGDQVVLAGPHADNGGTQVTVNIGPALPAIVGSRFLLLIADDNDNPPTVVTHPDPIVLLPAIAGLAPGTGSNRYAVANGVVYFSRSEAHDGNQAFNGDGADGDAVMAALDLATLVVMQGTVTVEKTSFAADTAVILPTQPSSTLVAWVHNEADEGADLDGDGGITDRNLAVWRLPDPMPTRNDVGGLQTLLGIRGGRVLATYSEAGQGPGGTNRTTLGIPPDGDAIDSVLAYLDPSVPIGNDSALVFFRYASAGGPVAVAAGDQLLAYLVSEAQQGGQDLTGDGDALDTVPFLGNLLVGGGPPGGGNAPIVGQAGAIPPLVGPRDVDPTAALSTWGNNLVAYVVNEPAYPGGDVNGDGLPGGYAIAFYNNTTNAEVFAPAPSPGAVTPGPGLRLLDFRSARLFFTLREQFRPEGLPGTNNDGDGGLDGEILCWLDPLLGAGAATLPVNVTGGTNMGNLIALALDGGVIQPLAPDWYGLVVQEGANGNVDINGNGTIDEAFLLLQANAGPAPVIHNPRLRTTGSTTIPRTGVGGDTGVLVRVLESLNGGDLDGDGNGNETLFAYIDFLAPTTRVILDAGGDHGAVAGGRIAVTAREVLTGTDYDGNGSSNNVVFRMFNADGTVLHAGTLSSPLSVPATDDGTVWAFLRDESAEGRDLNGDGDSFDLILGVVRP
jgi:hypothetical protein